jgi:chromosome partitioning protein
MELELKGHIERGDRMSHIIAVANQKGGCAKTTTSHILALGLRNRGYKVLLVDLDPQSNLSLICEADEATPTAYEVLQKKVSAEYALFHSPHIDIIPGSPELSGADVDFNKLGSENLLREALEPIRGAYDFIIIDTPPAIGKLTINALTAADSVLIPVGCNILSLQGMGQLYSLIMDIRKYTNKNLSILGTVVTRYKSRTRTSREVLDELQNVCDLHGIRLFDTKIREAAPIERYQSDQVNPYITERRAAVMQDYECLIDRIENILKKEEV